MAKKIAKKKVTKEIKREMKKPNTEDVQVNVKAIKRNASTKEEVTLKDEGVHLNTTAKRDILNPNKFVGVNIGITKNLDNFESLRVDVWLADNIQEGETHLDALERITNIAVIHADNTVEDVLDLD